MSQPSEIAQKIAKLNTAIEQRQIAPLTLYRELQSLAARHLPLSRFDDYHDGGQQWQEGRAIYIDITNLLLKAQLPHVAHIMLQDWWTAMGKAQQQSGRRYPLAIPSQFLTLIFLSVGDPGLAYRWSLLTHAHDLQSNMTEALALNQLRTTFGLSEHAAQRLEAIGVACMEEARTDWAQPCGFPEEVIRRFVLDSGASDTHTGLIANHTTRHDFPLSQGYLRALLKRIDSIPNDPAYRKEKGDSLEEIAGYLMSLLPGCVPRSKVLSKDKAFESDILVAHVYTQPTIISDLFGRYILVECKNYATTVDVSRVGYFLHRMRMVHAQFGIIFASQDVTGRTSEEEIAARALIRRAFHEDSNICVVISREDLDQLADGNVSFYWLLQSKYEEFRFGTPQ